MNPVEAEIIQQERKERMADSKTGDKREPSRDTVRDLRRYSCMIEDADDRELIQHAADMLEVAYRPSAPSATRESLLEETAKVCEQMRPVMTAVNLGNHTMHMQRDTLDNAARLIRALK